MLLRLPCRGTGATPWAHPKHNQTMSDDRLSVALISDVFFDSSAEEKLRVRLLEAKKLGADIALLPEICFNPWSPATKLTRDEDTEPFGGPRQTMAECAARSLGIGLVCGLIQTYPDGKRRNVALTFDARGNLLQRYAKLHLPEEPGFWEDFHYEPGNELAHPVSGFALKFGVQICSDINRPEGCHLLEAYGAQAVFAPRATELLTYDRWRCVFRANAITSCMYVLSVNRPEPEHGVLIGGPSVAVDPFGHILVETTETIAVVELDEALVRKARKSYPGYLPVRSDLYAKGWAEAPDLELVHGGRSRLNG